MNGKILIVEDDQAIGMAVRGRLRSEGYSVELRDEGESGFETAVEVGWDLIVLDLMLPGRDGLEICRDVRAKGIATPILMLTARDDTADKVVGLKMGADDYLTKPFEMIELVARVEALLRRASPAKTCNTYAIGSSTFDVRRGELHRSGSVTPLTTYEIKLLKFFCERRGEIIDRETSTLRRSAKSSATANTRSIS